MMMMIEFERLAEELKQTYDKKMCEVLDDDDD